MDGYNGWMDTMGGWVQWVDGYNGWMDVWIGGCVDGLVDG